MSLQFEVWTTQSIIRSSCVEITSSKCLQHDVPIKGGLRDPRFGVIGPGKCTTCGKTRTQCPGHFGHLKLAAPMYHISWMSSTLYFLRHICEECGAFKTKCGHKNGKYAWDKFRASVTRNGEPFPAQEAHERFQNHEDAAHLVLHVLPVPPIHVRPPLVSGGKTLGENDLTYRLQNIIRKNEILARLIRSKKPYIVQDQAREGLQNAIIGYINHHKLNNRRNRNKREYTSLTARLSSKEGRVRANLMGKRANSTARCVITPDDRLALGEIGVPASVAKTLTKDVKVTSYNKQQLELLLEQGKIRYIRKPDGSRIDTSIRKPSLEVGWNVERSMQNEDVVLFNRQPSLHKMSMMAHTVRILPYDTFRMNVACTSPYNADFDGDEMNVHFPQTIMAEAEAREIMCVQNQIVSPQSNKPVIGLIQDGLLGMFLLSGADVHRHDAMQILQQPLPNQPTFQGNQLISKVLPNINYHRGDVHVKHGQILSGRFTKRDLGTSHGSLVHVIYNDLGPTACAKCMHDLQRLSHAYLQLRGFTIGLGDLVRSREVTRLCEEERAKAYADVEHKNELETNIRLNNCRNIMGKAAISQLDESNALYTMVACGSKGSLVNITQLQACIGQQNVRGGRIPKEWSNRTMTNVQPGDNHPCTRGFVEHCFLEGLTSSEMYFLNQAGREGLIDTAIKTAETGYISRRLSKALENIRTCADGSCKDGDRLICFQYGDDGLDAMRIEKQKFQGFDGPDKQYIRSMTQDPSVSGTEYYHLPIPVQRILEDIPHKHTQMQNVELDMFVSQFPPLIGSWIRAHTPDMEYTHFCQYRERVMREYQRAKVCAGESVGAVAAQSIGERTTQCTLNSVDYNEHLVLYNVEGCIGEVIDGIIRRANKTGEVIHVETKNLRALTFNKYGTVSWRKVTAVTRHPPENEDGSNLLVKITTQSGRQLTCTRAKSFMVLRGRSWDPIRGCDLKVGDQVPVIAKLPTLHTGSPEDAYARGVYLATGNMVQYGHAQYPRLRNDERVQEYAKRFKVPLKFENQHITVFSHLLGCRWNKNFPRRVIGADPQFQQAFVDGYIKYSSTVENGITLVEAKPDVRDGLALLLQDCTLYPRGLTLNTNKHKVQIKDTWCDTIVNIEDVPSSHPYVYDLTVESTKNMVALNGIGCRDTFHFAGDSSKNVTLGIPRFEEILNLSKRIKTPLRTYKGELLPKYVKLTDVLVSRGKPRPEDQALLQPFWEFPDPGEYKGEVERWELYPWHDVEALRKCVQADIAYTQGPRVVCHVYGFSGDIRNLTLQGTPGGEWCKRIGNHVETSYTVHQLWEKLQDNNTIYSNDVLEIYNAYGIEAARACILREIRKINSHYGIYINIRHLQLLADWMTHSGLTPLTRHGMKRLRESPLKRSTFEEVVDVFHKAALQKAADPVTGVSACILTGKEITMGSNLVTVMKDRVTENKYAQPYPVEEIEMFSWIPKPTF